MREYLADVGESQEEQHAHTAIRLLIASVNAIGKLCGWGTVGILTSIIGVGVSALSQSKVSPSANLNQDLNTITITYKDIPCITSESDGVIFFYDLYSVNLDPDVETENYVIKVIYAISLNIIARIYQNQGYYEVPLGQYTFGYWTYYYMAG
ncbi:MAG: hypothetical protein ACTSSP_12835 [Candidatus Asgardarchaeia archaeon]